MASQLPAAVKAADLGRFALRASQLEKAKPIISYYCKFWIVNHILSRNLHATNEDCLGYTTNLMEQLEQFKAANRDNDAITDDLAGKAYVEQFGLETLQRAENAMRANKASRQTADTLQAAATFLELQQIWGDLDPDSAAKIKYAKYHALRIAKALKAGEDPNASNPAPESSRSIDDDLPALDPIDPEVETLNSNSSKPRQPFVVDVPDETDLMQKDLARQSSLDESLHPSRASPMLGPTLTIPRQVADVPDETSGFHRTLARASSPARALHPSGGSLSHEPSQGDVSPVDASVTTEEFYNQTSTYDVSPLGPEPSASERKLSIGGNYFPQVSPPQPTPKHCQEQQPSLYLPSAPADFASESVEPTVASTGTSNPPAPPYQLPHTQQPPHLIQPSRPLPPSFEPQGAPPQPRRQQQQQQDRAFRQAHGPPSAVPVSQEVSIVVDEEAMAKAQKHARWAISALNFEDVPTAIRELRGALETLGAR